MFKKIFQFLIGVLSLPVCVAVSSGLYEQLAQIRQISDNQKYFLFGAIAYLVIHIVLFKPQYLYILGHEVMHVLATWISGGKVTSFKVSSKGGKVTANKSNFFIALVPYFFPFYTIVVALLFFTVPTVLKTEPSYPVFLFLVGFTLTFHIVVTIDFLKIKQTDFLHTGYLLSVCLIYIMNLIIIGLIFSFLFEEVIFTEFLQSVYVKSKDIYIAIFNQLFL